MNDGVMNEGRHPSVGCDVTTKASLSKQKNDLLLFAATTGNISTFPS